MARGGRGKRKGGSFERQFAKRLSLWWTDGEEDDVFWRSQTSGARATTRTRSGKKTKGQYGDIAAVDSRGAELLEFATLELKTGYPNECVFDFVDQQKQPPKIWSGWINQAKKDHKESGSMFWAVVHQRMRRRAIIAAPTLFFTRLGTLNREASIYVPGTGTVGVMVLDSFFERCHPSDVSRCLSYLKKERKKVKRKIPKKFLTAKTKKVKLLK